MQILHPKNKKFLYDDADAKSIIEYALKLHGVTLSSVICISDDDEKLNSNKGKFGQILEKYYFFKKLNSDSCPDFPAAQIELKSCPLKKLSRKSEFRAKERLVLNIINYEELANQNFINSSFLNKNSRLLLVFYIYNKLQTVFEYPIKLVGLWEFPDNDLEIIRQDWENIQTKVRTGKAHELSEGDTFYLGACTKGKNSQSLRTQPYSNIPAKQRAFSLKQGYVNHIIAKLSGSTDGSFGKIIRKPTETEDLESLVIRKFSKYYGQTEDEIASKLGLLEQKQSKQFYAMLTKKILGIDYNKEIEEFSKADIVVKTIRIQKNNLPKESISFPAFKYKDIMDENCWEESSFHQFLERKFLFIFFKYHNNTFSLEKAVFWTMPYYDKEQAHKIWSDLRQLLSEGKIIKSINIHSKRRTTYFTDIKNSVIHIRPHAKNAADTYPLPTPDKLTGNPAYTKHCFWLNADYVRDNIYLK